ncbi:hypothetical protein [Prosthecobacter sp.]|uniref:hypothetical protein n=1 Tax=Prosthecobacter sp. TaxID=1965333 RepID=UPI003783C07A
MNSPRARSCLRSAVIVSSLGLLLGCSWFAHKQANPAMRPSSKIGPPPPMIMSGSKSLTTGIKISSGALQTGALPQPVKP